MPSTYSTYSFHDIFVDGHWDLKQIQDYFGDIPIILNRVLERGSCSVDIVKLLLKHGADINREDESGWPPLMSALRVTRNEEVIRVLLEEGADVNKVDYFGRTPLLLYLQRVVLNPRFSAPDCSVDVVKLLLQYGADVNCRDVFGKSPLVITLQRRRGPEIIQALLESGADVNIVCESGETPLLVALKPWFSAPDCSVDVVKLLLQYGADVNCRDVSGNSPLVITLQRRRGPEIIQALLESGADVNIVCESGETPLLVALNPWFSATDCSVDVVKLLLQYGADVNCRDASGNTPLHCAVRNEACNSSVINYLLQDGSLVNVKNNVGETPLMLAWSQQRDANVFLELLIAGAQIEQIRFGNGGGDLFGLLEFLAEQDERCDSPSTLKCYRMLVKFIFLQNRYLDINDLERASKWKGGCTFYRKSLSDFVKECLSELEMMDSMQVGNGRTFREFVAGNLDVENWDLDEILKNVVKGDSIFASFPSFRDVIFARVKKMMFELKYCPDFLNVRSVNLTFTVLRRIATFSSDDDFLGFILAFYSTDNQNESSETSQDNTTRQEKF